MNTKITNHTTVQRGEDNYMVLLKIMEDKRVKKKKEEKGKKK